MRTRTQIFGWVLVVGGLFSVVLLLKFALPPLADRLHVSSIGGEGRVEVLDCEFGTVYSRISPEVARLFADELAAFFSTMIREFGPRFAWQDVELSDLSVRLDLWEDQAELAAYYENTRREDFSNNGGYYDPSSRTIAIVVDDPLSTARRSAFHEGIHLMFDVFAGGRGARFPRWLSEGLAVYFEGATIRNGLAEVGGRERMAPYLVWSSRSEVLKGADESRWPTLPQVLDAEREFRESDNVFFYAYSLFLTHYFLEESGPEVERRFLELCRDPPLTFGSVRSLAGRLGLSVEELETGFQSFLRDLLGA